METSFRPINTVFSVNSILNIRELVQAKLLMNNKYGNQYSHIPPHIGFTIMPFPQENLEKGIHDLEEYIQQQKPFPVHISNLIYNDKDKFFYVDLSGEMIKKHHKNITRMLNKYRMNYIREKDIERLNNKDFDEQSIKYLSKYGYSKVFDNYLTHITIGNFTVENVNVKELRTELEKILQPTLNRDIILNNIHGVFHTDSANNQSEMKQIWDKVYTLI